MLTITPTNMNLDPNPTQTNMNMDTTTNPTNAPDNAALVRSPKSHVVTIRVPTAIHHALKAKAVEDDRTVSKVFLKFALAGGLTPVGPNS